MSPQCTVYLTHTPRNMVGTSLVPSPPRKRRRLGSADRALSLPCSSWQLWGQLCLCLGLWRKFRIVSSGLSILNIFCRPGSPFVDFKVQKLTWDMSRWLTYSRGGVTHLKMMMMMTEYWIPWWIRKLRCQLIIKWRLKRITKITVATGIPFVSTSAILR